MRMLWKPNKIVQIFEVDEELFLVEFKERMVGTRKKLWICAMEL